MINFKDYCKDDYRRKVKKAFEDDTIYMTRFFIIADRFNGHDLTVIVKRRGDNHEYICNATVTDVRQAFLNGIIGYPEYRELSQAFRQHTELNYQY